MIICVQNVVSKCGVWGQLGLNKESKPRRCLSSNAHTAAWRDWLMILLVHRRQLAQGAAPLQPALSSTQASLMATKEQRKPMIYADDDCCMAELNSNLRPCCKWPFPAFITAARSASFLQSFSRDSTKSNVCCVLCYNKGAVEWNKSSISIGLNIVAMTTSDISLNSNSIVKSDVIAYLYLVFVGIFKLGFSGKFHLCLLR